MAFYQDLGDGERWAQVRYERVDGRGYVVPRLSLQFEARTLADNTWAALHDVRVRLLSSELQVIGEGQFGPVELSHHETAVEVEVPLSLTAISFIDQKYQGDLDLIVELKGWLRCWAKPPTEPKETWQSIGRHQNAQLRIQVPRSEWYTKVLHPMGVGEYVFFEMPMPTGGLRSDFQKALVHLATAQQHYATGNDPGVFFECRAAFDALPGAKQKIFDGISDEKKRDQIDELARQIGAYLHTGRHVATRGQQQGDFPVDHRDAQFALLMTRLLVAYSSKLLDT